MTRSRKPAGGFSHKSLRPLEALEDRTTPDSTAPTAALVGVRNVTSGTTDLTKYTFEVMYTDHALVKASTVDDSDVTVIAPDGTVLPAHVVPPPPDFDSGMMLVTYSVAAPGGQFTTQNGGTYTIHMQADQVTDQAAQSVAAGDLGTFNVDVTAPPQIPPTAALTSPQHMIVAPAAPITFQITYKDDGKIKVSTLGDNNVMLIAATGIPAGARFVSATPNTDASTVVATYQVVPLSGPSPYLVLLQNTVTDEEGLSVVGGNSPENPLGSFDVSATPSGQTEVSRFAVGSGAGGNSTVTVRDASNSVLSSPDVFPGFTGGVRVAEADVNGDGVPDLIAGTGPGVATQVKVISGKDGSTLFTVQPFEASFTGGVYVAAGNINYDGRADVVVTPDEGGGPVVAIYDGAKIASGATGDAAQIVRFLGIDDPNFRGGARAAVAEIGRNGPVIPALVVAAGFGGGPRVAVFNGDSLASTDTPVTPKKFVGDFFVFEPTLRNGVFVTTGDLDGDGTTDLVAGAGPGGGPRVFALSGAGLFSGTQTPIANFFAGDTASRGGVRVVAKDLDGDGRADLVTGAGDGAGSQVTAYAGKDIPANGTPGATLFQSDAVPGFTNGVYVG